MDISYLYKYPLMPGRVTTRIPMPDGAKPLRVDFDPNKVLCLWAIVTPKNEDAVYQVNLVGTGDMVDEKTDGQYLNTFFAGEFVFHAFFKKGWNVNR